MSGDTWQAMCHKACMEHGIAIKRSSQPVRRGREQQRGKEKRMGGKERKGKEK